MHRGFMRWAAILGALAVALGAYGAHKLKEVGSPHMIDVFETGVRYQFYHSIVLLVVSSLFKKLPTRWLTWSAICLIVGIFLFSGSLYLIVWLRIDAGPAISPFTILTPLGGFSLMAGWLCLFGAAVQKY